MNVRPSIIGELLKRLPVRSRWSARTTSIPGFAGGYLLRDSPMDLTFGGESVPSSFRDPRLADLDHLARRPGPSRPSSRPFVSIFLVLAGARWGE